MSYSDRQAAEQLEVGMRMEVRQELRKYLENNHLFGEMSPGLGDDASLLEHGIIDSIGVMELVAFVTTRFQIDVEPHEVTPETFDSIDRLTEFILRRRPAPGTCLA
jgi:acyl carrier protein